MAEALVGGAFLSGFINVLFDRLLSPDALNFIRGNKLDQQLLDRLKNALLAAEALLTDAEKKQFHDKRVKEWLNSLQDAVYMADDLLDHVFTKAAATQNKEVSNFLSRFLNSKDREMVTKMEEILGRIEDIVKYSNILGLKEIPKEKLSWRTPSTSLVEGEIYGRENDKETMIKLLKDENTDAKISVIPIVGMGGVGKTTLAQWLYNNEDLMKEFDLKVWVCVSEDFKIVKITQTIIEAITSRPCDMKDLNLLQLDLKDKLTGKKFFIVLDDVWNEAYGDWNNLKKPFQHGVKGSKILVTTRSKKVASVIQTCPPYLLNELSDEYCWSVFANHACFPESNGNPTLEKIGKNIVKRCKGLPLAAQTLGGLLRVKHDVKEWSTILTSEIWEFSVVDSKIVPALLISYYHLPPHSKRCFVYCSLYPKDYSFNKEKLILLWMAEDLLPPAKRGKTLEEVGFDCFDDLASRLFFKHFSTDDDDESFVMHDLMHDLAKFVAGEFYFRSEELGNADEMSTRTRHLSYGRLSHPISKNCDAIGRVKSLRTLLKINIGFSPPLFSSGSTPFFTLSELKLLRVLSFANFHDLDVLPDSIGELIHLRYLDLSNTSIKTLPESLSNLYHLQTLKLCYCHSLKMLPNGIQNLVNLRHLDLSNTSIKTLPESLSNLYNLQTLKVRGCRRLTMLPNGIQSLVNLRHLDILGTNLEEMPPGMSNLKNLQHLDYFVVGKHEENGIMELGELSNIHGSLIISKLENVASSSEALKARIMDMAHIETLEFKWSTGDDDISSQIERDILDKLQPHKGLQELTIKGYRGTIFPDWVGHSSYHNMTYIVLESCSNCCMLPSLGQLPSLMSLCIRNFNGPVMIGEEFYKSGDDHSSLAAPFPSLQKLEFYNLPYWEVWHSFESNVFPQLKELTIWNCPRLAGDLPNHLPALETLEIIKCGNLNRLDHFPALQTLEIHNCDKLISCLPKAPTIHKLSIIGSDKVEFQEMPHSVQSFSIRGCEVVKSVFQAITITHLTCLKYLSINNCSCAISFPGDCIPVSVKTLEISNCRKLEFPRQQHELLEYLSIKKSCDSLTSFPLDSFPKLENLKLEYCQNLESLSVSQSQVAALHELRITGCPNFVSFPAEGLDAPSMSRLWVDNCNKLKSLSCHMNTLLPKLDRLDIWNCPEIELFPDGGLPPNIKSIMICNCEKLLSGLSSMGVHQALTRLEIRGPCESVRSFPKQGLLPHLPSLTILILYRLSSLETLDCKELIHLTSLQKLSIKYCPKLENMTGERLPASLIQLHIKGSPLLEERFNMKDPRIWPKVSHIPGVRVDYKWIT